MAFLHARSHSFARTMLGIFPPPVYLSMPAAGLDISDESVKFIELMRTRYGIRVKKHDTRGLPPGVIQKSRIQDEEMLGLMLKKLRVDHNLRFVRASLPEEHAYFFQTDVPKSARRGELRDIIAAELEENVPLAPEDALFDAEFVEGRSSKNFLTANVAVYPRQIVEKYLSIMNGAGLVPLALEIESQASARAVIPENEQDTVMVVDVGRSKAGLAIVSRGVLLFTATLGMGGDDFTDAVMKGMNIPREEAEYHKRTKTFIRSGSNEAFFNAMLTSLSAFRDEVNRHYQYWLEHGSGGSEDLRIKKIIVTGGNANIIGVAEYFSSTIHLPVVRGNVWTNVCNFDEYIPPICRRESFRFGTAIGLALASLA